MPNYKAHLAGGATTFAVVFFICAKTNLITITTSQLPFYLFLCLFGSLFPDIDTKSKIQKILYYPIFLIILATIILKKWETLFIFSIIAFIPILSNHRKLTHKTWFVILIPLIIPVLIFNHNKNLLIPALTSYLFFVSGALSHIVLDFGPKKLFK